MIALLFAFITSAQAYDVRLCGQWTPSYQEGSVPDDDMRDHNDDGIVDNDRPDYMNSNDPQPLRGLWLVAEAQMPTGAWVVEWSGYAPATGVYAGCTDEFTPGDYNVLGHAKVRLTVTSVVGVGPHVLTVKDSLNNEEVQAATHTFPTITASGRYDYSYGGASARMSAGIALAWALEREDGNVSAMTLDVYTCSNPGGANQTTCPASGGGVYYHSVKRMFIGGNAELTLMLHELGHAIRAHAGVEVVPTDFTWDQSSASMCPSPAGVVSNHFQTSDEATGGSINEGFADYYAAVILNKTSEADAFLYGPYDWDHDGQDEVSNYFSIERKPTPWTNNVGNRDYWADQCDQPIENLSSEYDWSRAFWDLDTDEGLTFQIILDLFVAAVDEPAVEWKKKVGPCSGNCPWQHMWAVAQLANDSAYGLPAGYIQDAWNNQMDNGIGR